MSISTTSVSLLLVFSLLSFTPLTSADAVCNSDDYKVLIKIREAFNNPYHLASWVSNTDCCGWYQLECDPNTGRVVELTIFTGNISGQIPSVVGDLPFLKTLEFRKLTNLTGSIPRSITKLTHLTMLRLSWNNLSGPIPGFLSELKNLTFLELNYNQFSGSIPSSLSKFTKLDAIHLDRNELTGSIPESFGHFSGTIPELYLSHNQLTGSIPKSLGDMQFGTIDLSRNKLTGDASMLFKPNGSTMFIDLSRNEFEFDFSKLEFQTNLQSLDLNHNKIYGSIPKAMTGLSNLQLFNVSYNRLCGEIPQGGKLQTFDSYSYFHNRCLCGSPLAECK